MLYLKMYVKIYMLLIIVNNSRKLECIIEKKIEKLGIFI